MAKKKAAPNQPIEVDLTDSDELFDASDTPDPVDEGATGEDEPPAAAAPDPQPEPPDEPEATPEPALDSLYSAGYLQAQQQIRQAEYEDELRALREKVAKLTEQPNREEETIRDLTARRKAAHAAYLAAIESGNERDRAAALFERDEASEQLRDLATQRSMREMRALHEQTQAPPAPDARAIQRSNEIKAATFRQVYRVTPEQEVAMARAWPEALRRHPEWANEPEIWKNMERAYAMVVGKRPSQGSDAAAMVEGGQHSAASRTTGVSRHGRSAVADAARQFGLDPQTYQRFVDGRLPAKDKAAILRKMGL